MILFIIFACIFNKPQHPKQHVHAQVEVVDSEIEITFVEQ